MKKDDAQSSRDDLRPEYSRDELGRGQRGKHVDAYCRGTNLSLLAPDVRAAFPTDEMVNDALRSVMSTGKRSA